MTIGGCPASMVGIGIGIDVMTATGIATGTSITLVGTTLGRTFVGERDPLLPAGRRDGIFQ